jgi:hypothetical protein
MKKDDFIKVVRIIVKQELKKELPNALAQCFQTLMAGKRDNISSPTVPPVESPSVSSEENSEDELTSLKGQLKEMLNQGTSTAPRPNPPQKKIFSKNPLLNEILNQTRSTSEYERSNGQSAARFGMAPTPTAAMVSGFSEHPALAATGVGELMSGNELSFMDNIPGMPGADSPAVSQLPTNGGRMLSENQAPMAGLPETVSALDVRNHPALPDTIKNVLKRDYRSLVRAMDKKK